MMPGGGDLGPGGSTTGSRRSDDVFSGIITTTLRALSLPSHPTGHHTVSAEELLMLEDIVLG